MIERFQLLRNVGQFDNVSPPQDADLSEFTLIYGENGRGKSTLASILRSLSLGAPALVTERHRLGADQPPHIVVKHTYRNFMFTNGGWDQALPDLVVYDDVFVAENVCSGIAVDTAHRQNLHELILGQQGVVMTQLKLHT